MDQLIRTRSIKNHLVPVAFKGQYLRRPTRKTGRSVWLCTETSCLEQIPKRTKQIKKSLQTQTEVALFKERLHRQLIILSTTVLRKAYQSGQLNLINIGAQESYDLSNQILEDILPGSLLTKLYAVGLPAKAVGLRSGKWTTRAEKILHTLEQLQVTNASPAEGSAIVFLKRVPKSHGIG